jgi:hypothetical protein
MEEGCCGGLFFFFFFFFLGVVGERAGGQAGEYDAMCCLGS